MGEVCIQVGASWKLVFGKWRVRVPFITSLSSWFMSSHCRASDGYTGWLEIIQDGKRERSQVQTQWTKSCC